MRTTLGQTALRVIDSSGRYFPKERTKPTTPLLGTVVQYSSFRETWRVSRLVLTAWQRCRLEELHIKSAAFILAGGGNSLGTQ